MTKITVQKVAILALFYFSSNVVFADDLKSTVNNLANQFFSDDKPGGVILVSKGNKILFHEAYGLADLSLQIPMTKRNTMGIASNTKPLTAVGVLKLVDSEKLKLEDDISKYIPGFISNESTVKIKHLLSHTSGIVNYNDDMHSYMRFQQQELDVQQMLSQFINKPLNFNPGEQYRYNNSAYYLLGLIIESISGKTYHEYMRTEIFEPLGMDSTDFNEHEKIIPMKARGYETKANGFVNSRYVSDTFSASPAGGIVTSTKDLFRFYRALFNGEIITVQTLEQAMKPFKLNDAGYSRTGFGWFVGNMFGHPFITHDGRGWDFVSSMIYVPDQELFVVVLSNSSWYGYGSGVAYFPHKIAASILGKPYVTDIKDSSLSKYAGIYKNGSNEFKEVVFESGKLYLVHHGFKSTISQIAEPVLFYVEDTYETLSFVETNDQIELTSSIGLSSVFTKTDQ